MLSNSNVTQRLPSRRGILVLASLLCWLGAPALWPEEADGAAILSKVDAFRSFGGSGYSYDFATTEDSGEASLMRVSVRLSGEEAALVKYLDPPKQRGRAVLVRGNAFWLFEPGMKSALRISPRQLLFGQASAGDVSRISFRSMYELLSMAEAPDGQAKGARVEGDRSEGGHVLRLKAKPGAGATYDFVDLRIGVDYRPLSADCRGSSGTLMKSIRYERYETIGGSALLTAFSIRDEIDGKTTKVSLSRFDRAVPPESSFSVQALKNYR